MIEEGVDKVWGMSLKEHPDVLAMAVGGAIVGTMVGFFMPVVGIVLGIAIAVLSVMYLERMSYKLLAGIMGITLAVSSVLSMLVVPTIYKLRGTNSVSDYLKTTPLATLSSGISFAEDMLVKMNIMNVLLGEKKSTGGFVNVYVPGEGTVSVPTVSEGVAVEEAYTQGV